MKIVKLELRTKAYAKNYVWQAGRRRGSKNKILKHRCSGRQFYNSMCQKTSRNEIKPAPRVDMAFELKNIQLRAL